MILGEYRKQLAGARGRLLVIVNLKNLRKLIGDILDSLCSGPGGGGVDLLLIINNPKGSELFMVSLRGSRGGSGSNTYHKESYRNLLGFFIPGDGRKTYHKETYHNRHNQPT